ncbi:MAG: hypothetical protein UY77_C0041G0001, partial [Candidatus Uhrbacteria bacterium GW2011_GWA2_53_10]
AERAAGEPLSRAEQVRPPCARRIGRCHLLRHQEWVERERVVHPQGVRVF